MKLAKAKVKKSTRSKPREELKENNKPFVRGFAPCRRVVERGSRYTRSCYNCDYYYKEFGDDEEVCQNPQVLSYDMIVTENNICCGQWKLSARKTDAKSLFRRGM